MNEYALELDYECLNCWRDFPLWALNGDHICASCLIDHQRVEEPHQVDMADVRGIRDRLLTRSDWTQVGDRPSGKSNKWATRRQQLRDITESGKPPQEIFDYLEAKEQEWF